MLTFLGQFLSSGTTKWPTGGTNGVSAMGGVLSLQAYVGKLCVSGGMNMNARIQSFPVEFITVARCSMLYTSTISGLRLIV